MTNTSCFPGNLSNPGIESYFLHCRQILVLSEPSWKPHFRKKMYNILIRSKKLVLLDIEG